MIYSPSRAIWTPPLPPPLPWLTPLEWEQGTRPWHKDDGWRPAARYWLPSRDVAREVRERGIRYPVRCSPAACVNFRQPLKPETRIGPATAPSAYWRLDNSGFTTPDSVTNTYTLSTQGSSAGNATGKINTAWANVAANQSLFRADANDALRVTGAFTFAGWAFQTAATGSGQVAGLGSKYQNPLGGKSSWLCGVFNTSGSIHRWALFTTSDGSTQTNCVDAVFGEPPLNTWVFVCARFNGSTTTSISLNAGTPTTATVTGVFGGTGGAGTNSQFQLGAWNGNTFLFQGSFDEVPWFQGTSLSDADVTTLYNAGAGLTYYSGAYHLS